MRREVTLEEISDGRLYDANDMVKADCQDCKGCHDCCTGMGDSVLLDPYDVCRLSRGLRKIPEELIKAMTTEQLLDACSRHPLAIQFYDDYEEPYRKWEDGTFDRFN